GRIDEIFKNEVDAGKRRSAWEASKQVGGRIAQDLLELVRLRNQAARSLGFKDYHALSLHLAEQSQEEVERVFAELFELSQAPFIRLRRQMDEKLADKFHIAISGLAPWHYQDPFFQEAPADGSFDPDLYYAGQDVKQLAMRFYSGIGLDVTDILANSDLYERDGKNPHAFSTDIDRCGDVRILCNLQNNERWMETLLHELGHATYDRYHDQSLPYLLRQPAHAFTTEAIAMFFGRFSRQPEWMRDMLNLPPAEYEKIKEASASSMAAKQLIFARWTMVMYYFEKELYADPDQDLNRLWWRLVEKYQMIHPPLDRHEPDWAAKIHFTIAPCYYHNYLLGELFASQLTDYVKNSLPAPAGGAWSAVGCTALGDTLRNRIFKPASRYRWDEMITRATGQPLSARCFVRQFITQ
ncbi:MAG TPA: M2 family metallopeptidase, partial [bacterium]|nr:M2 family metallopeptidase [bacterium]